MSPTELSLRVLRAEGWLCAIVERFNAHLRIRQDLWGFADILALKAGEPPMLVQTTSASNVSSRVKKILESERAREAHAQGARIVVHGWAGATKTRRRRTQRVILPFEGVDRKVARMAVRTPANREQHELFLGERKREVGGV